jgi:hypothetical protein
LSTTAPPYIFYQTFPEIPGLSEFAKFAKQAGDLGWPWYAFRVAFVFSKALLQGHKYPLFFSASLTQLNSSI